jgi:hypothetical protein
MTAQIIFPKQDTYWILTDGVSYFDGLTAANCVTTVGSSTQIYWIGTSHDEYVQACLDLGITPRNPGDNTLVAINPASPASFLDQKINELTDKINESVIKITNDISVLSTQQQETITKLDPIDANIIDLQQKSEQVNISDIENINTKIDSLSQTIPGVRISATQARLWLIGNNFDLGMIDTVINGIEDDNVKKIVQAQWEYSPYIERNNPWLNQVAKILNIDLDVVFSEAINL